MIRGIYTATSALRAATMHQTRITHNISNLQTAGFKQILTAHQAYELQALGKYRAEDAAFQRGVGATEQGLLVPEEIVDFRQGNLEQTDRPLDLAIEGPAFFRLQTPEGERYTRDGSFHRDGLGRLVNADGHFVLSADGQQLALPAGMTSVGRNGVVSVNGQLVDQIGLVAFDNLDGLARENGNRYRIDGEAAPVAANASVQQGYLETSNVDENAQILEMMRVLRLYQASQKTLQVQDGTLSQAIEIGIV